MQGDLFRVIEVVEVDEASQRRLNVRGPLQLQRAWPRAADHLLLEYRDAAGRLLPGQWRGGDGSIETTLMELQQCFKEHQGGAKSVILRASDYRILLQPDGEDRKLKPLRSFAHDFGADLLSHRPEKRAVVRLRVDDDDRYVKVTSPAAATNLIRAAEHLGPHSGGTFTPPKLLSHDAKAGVTAWSALPGVNVFSLAPHEVAAATDRISRSLRAWHELPTPFWARRHDGEAEADVVEGWLRRRADFFPQLADDGLNNFAEPCLDSLRRLPYIDATIHRDFYDKQIILDPHRAVGIIDFDTMARGDPALDAANFLAHLSLRAMQRNWPDEVTQAAAQAFLSGYGGWSGPDPAHRLETYQRAAAIRLMCVYAFRPKWRQTITPLQLDRLMRCSDGISTQPSYK